MHAPVVVLARLRLAAQSRAGFIFSVHAFARATERTITRHDVINAFLTAQHAEEQDNGTWKIKGLDHEGDELTVIVSLGDRIEIITIM